MGFCVDIGLFVCKSSVGAVVVPDTTSKPARCGSASGDLAMNILLAIDDSPYSAEAVEAVARLGRSKDTQVRVISAVQRLGASSGKQSNGDQQQEILKKLDSQALELTTRASDSLRARGFKAEPAVLKGDARSAIIDEALESSADLIVIGSHGRTGVTRWPLGSVAQFVVTNAHCSVLVVREMHQRSEETEK